MPQVSPEHYRTDEYNSVERFCSYAHQLKLIAGLDVESILEVGPGTFLVSDALKRRGYNVTTCDFDPELGADITADVRRLPLADGSFDLVMACQVLEHIPFQDFETALVELRRVTRKIALISLPCRMLALSVLCRFSAIERLFKRKHVEFSLRIPRSYSGLDTNGEHYWEIDRSTVPLKEVRQLISRHFKIAYEGYPAFNKYHYFFVVSK
jgi:SAM-dependent methyltransferase